MIWTNEVVTLQWQQSTQCFWDFFASDSSLFALPPVNIAQAKALNSYRRNLFLWYTTITVPFHSAKIADVFALCCVPNINPHKLSKICSNVRYVQITFAYKSFLFYFFLFVIVSFRDTKDRFEKKSTFTQSTSYFVRSCLGCTALACCSLS